MQTKYYVQARWAEYPRIKLQLFKVQTALMHPRSTRETTRSSQCRSTTLDEQSGATAKLEDPDLHDGQVKKGREQIQEAGARKAVTTGRGEKQ